MPEAVNSNSTDTSGIHPLYLIDALDNLSDALQAYSMMLDSLLDTSGNLSGNIAHGIGQLLDYIISRFDQLKEQIKTLLGQPDMSATG